VSIRVIGGENNCVNLWQKINMNDNQLKQDHYKVKPKDHSNPGAVSPGNEDLEKPVSDENSNYLHGRGAQFNTKNRFLKDEKTREHIESIDDWSDENIPTQYLEQESKTIRKQSRKAKMWV
jgi:hypothetical protein